MSNHPDLRHRLFNWVRKAAIMFGILVLVLLCLAVVLYVGLKTVGSPMGSIYHVIL